jgi:hypothetical protein
MSLDHPAPPGTCVVELPGPGDDVHAWFARKHDRGGGGVDEALLERDEHSDRGDGRHRRDLEGAELFFARLEAALLRAELEGRHLAVLLFTIAPSDRERAETYVLDVMAAAGQELLPCDVLALLRPHLVAVLLADVDAHDLRISAPRGDTRSLTYPADRLEIEALRRRRHPWLRLQGGGFRAAS